MGLKFRVSILPLFQQITTGSPFFVFFWLKKLYKVEILVKLAFWKTAVRAHVRSFCLIPTQKSFFAENF